MAKRAFDLLIAGLGLVVLAPVLLIVAITVRIALGSPVLFRQRRPGLLNRPFELLKFRTMTHARDASGELMADEARLTAMGRFLRRSSLDELPQLVNVVRGEMSLVGPRPLLMEYVPLYSERHAHRTDVRPGITGWAQVRGRNALGWEEKLDLDIWYVEHRSLALDIWIVVLTFVAVITARGISQQGHATTERFRGIQQ